MGSRCTQVVSFGAGICAEPVHVVDGQLVHATKLNIGHAATTKRYIALGLARDIETWRKEIGLSHREVIVVSTRDGHRALRGLGSGEYQVITLESWDRASQDVRDAVAENLRIIGHTATVT